jgi:hypothetical protein
LLVKYRGLTNGRENRKRYRIVGATLYLGYRDGEEGLVSLVLVGKILSLYVVDILTDGVGHDSKQVGIPAKELGREVLVHAQHIVCYEDLTIGWPCSDTDDGNGELLTYSLTELGWYLLQHYGKASSFL